MYFAEILIMINTYIVYITYFAITAYNETNSFHHIKKTLQPNSQFKGTLLYKILKYYKWRLPHVEQGQLPFLDHMTSVGFILLNL